MRTTLSILAVLMTPVALYAAKPASPRQEKPQFAPEPVKVQSGVASWYGGSFIGGKTANGEIYHAGDFTAAHRSLPFNTYVRVTDRRTGRSTVVRINNRGPFVKGRVLDVSRAAAQELGITKRGVARVKLEVLRKLPSQPAAMAENERKTARVDFFSTWFRPRVAVD